MNLHTQLYEQAGDGGSGGSGGQGSAASGGGAAAASAAAASGSLFTGVGASAAVSGQGASSAAEAQSQVAAAGASPYFVGLYDSTGKIDEAKWDTLPTDIKPYAETFKKYKTIESLLRGTANLAQLAGKKGLQPLPADAPPEALAERAALMRQLNNVPEKPEGYGVAKPEGLPDGVWNPEYANGMLGILHKHNASPELVKELFGADAKMMGEQVGQSQAAQAAQLEAEAKVLRTEFGTEFPQKMDLAMRGARTAGLDPMNDPIFKTASGIKLALKLAENVAEDKLISGNNDQTMGGNDRAKALSVVHDESNPLHKAYHDPEHPGHDAAVKQVMAFNQRYLAAKKARE